MIIQFHTKDGIIVIDSETVNDHTLQLLGLTRDEFNEQFNLQDIARAQELLASSPDVITQPEMWELIRIFGRRLGFQFD